MSTDRLRLRLSLPLLIAVLIVTGACGSSSSKANSSAAGQTTTTTAASRPTTTTTASTPAATTAPVPAQQNQTGTGALTIQNFAFNPNQLNTTAGPKLTVTNKDSFDHAWTADDGAWDSGHISS